MRYNDPLVSVIIPCYNCSSTIVPTLESIRNQLYKNYEIICINDGSTDKTESVIRNWSLKNSIPILLVNQQNSGVSRARNIGISNSSGDYICFVDADDEFSPLFLKSLIMGILDYNCDVSYCKITRNRDSLTVSKITESDIQTQDQAMRTLLYRMGEIGFSCFLYNRDMLINSNLLFDEDIRYGEDRSFVWKYLVKQKKIAFIDSELYWYRKNDKSATRNKTQSWNRTDSLTAVIRTEQYLKKNRCSFVNEYKRYMYPRDMWAVCKAYAVSGDIFLFEKLIKTFNVRKCMRYTKKDKNVFVRIASKLFLINPFLFYYTIKTSGRFMN